MRFIGRVPPAALGGGAPAAQVRHVISTLSSADPASTEAPVQVRRAGASIHPRARERCTFPVVREHRGRARTLSIRMLARVGGSRMSGVRRAGWAWAACLGALAGCAGAAPAPVAPAGPPAHVDAQPRIVTPAEVTTEPELARRAERALMEQRWRDAVDAY